MRVVKKKPSGIHEGDLTPMIDMTFQLIAFFMVLVNFSDAEQDQRIKLPISELAKPPDMAYEEPRYVHLTDKGTVIFTGDEVPIASLERLLQRERQVLERTPNKSPAMVTVIIRAHKLAKTGEVQKIIEDCQKATFEKFALRTEQKEQ